MRRGTTPTLRITCSLPLDECKSVWLTIKQPGVEITKKQGDLAPTEDGFAVTLTQAETLRLMDSVLARVQLRALLHSGSALASNIAEVPVGAILKDGEIT